jgi:MFS family permease
MGALMIPQVLSTIQLAFSGPRLARALSYYSMVLALGVAAGQIFGGLIVGANLFGQSWRIAFLINVPIGIVVLLLGRAHLPAGTRRQAVRLDLIGVGLLGLSMALLLLPMMFGRDQGWPLWTWLSLAAGAIGLVGFVGHERGLVARDARPLLDLRALRPRGTKPGLLALCLLNYSFAGLLFPLTLHLQTALGYTPLQAGLMLVPYPIGFATVGLTWTRSPVRWHARLPVVGLVVFSAAAALLAFTVHIGWPVPLAAAILSVAGAGMATAMSPLINQVAATVGPAYASAVSALISTGTLLSSVLAITTAGGLYLTFAEHDAARSATGITWSFTLVSALLLLATACAVRIWYVSTRMPGRTGN